MHHTFKAKLFYGLIVCILNSSVKGETAKCVCTDKTGTYFSSNSARITCNEEVNMAKIDNTGLELAEKLLKTIEALTLSAGQKSNDHCVDCATHKKYIFPRSCAEATANTRRSGTYDILLETYKTKPFQVSCEEELYDGGWTVVLRRMDGSIDFFRNWTDYKHGFGNLEGEFFIGLDKMYELTNGQYPQELLFVLRDFDNVSKYAKYSSFAIGDESEHYVLKTLGNYSGDAGDSLKAHAGQPFKTREIPDPNNCATQYTGAWWYKACHASNLCGSYLKGAYGQEKYAQGVVWHSWHGHNYSLKFVQMMIRPKRL